MSESHRRLLDMLAGWEYHLRTFEEYPIPDWQPPEGEADAIAHLYADAGSIEDMSPDDVEHFIETRVLPLLLS